MHDNKVKWLLLFILVVVITLLILQIGALTGWRVSGANSPWPQDWGESLGAIPWKSIWIVSGAVIVGAMGAWAFHLGVVTGFIARTERGRTLEFLLDQQGRSRSWTCAAFFVTGGIVAGVFQMAQSDTFAPIQAFVLGATWPSVVTRIMSGEGGRLPGTLVNPADTPPPQVPAPPGAAAVPPAEVAV